MSAPGTQFVENVADRIDNLQVGSLVVPPNVIAFTDFAFVKDQVNSLAVIPYPQPVANVESLTVDGNGLMS